MQSPDLYYILDNHSLKNILTSLRLLTQLGESLPGKPLQKSDEVLVRWTGWLNKPDAAQVISKECGGFFSELYRALEGIPENSDVKDAFLAVEKDIRVIEAVLGVRLEERINLAGKVYETTGKQVGDKLRQFFNATQEVSLRRWCWHEVQSRNFIREKCAGEICHYIYFEIQEKLRISLRVEDTLRDLMANSRKYSPKGGLIALQISQDERELLIVAEDEGIGIPKEEIPRVTEYGYRASNVRRFETRGDGCGLTKAKALCDSLNGRMEIESELGKGTCIKLRLPSAAFVL